MSELIGHQMPRLWCAPPSVGSFGQEITELAELAGLVLDPWQVWLMEQSLAHTDEMVYNDVTGRYEPRWAAKEVGIVVSRQNGKGSYLEARELAGLFLLGERMIIHSAHQFDTSKEAFSRILFLVENTPDLDAQVARVTRSHGEEGIELRNGQRLRFRTRTKGGGRGFTGDCLILDEAMYLGAPQVAALMPTLSARPNPQIIYTGSAGDKESTQLGHTRARALKGGDAAKDLFYAEWSIDSCNDFCPHDCEDHDSHSSVDSYAKANPGLGIRITVDHIEMERRSMDAETFAQERLGVGDWPVDGDQWAVVSEEAWTAREDELSEVTTDLKVIAVDTTPDRAYSCIGIAGGNEDGNLHVEITSREAYDYRPGTKWVVPRILQLVNGSTKPAAVVIDKNGQAGGFIDELEEAGVTLLHPLGREYAEACGAFYSSVVPRKDQKPDLVHIGQVPLTNAVAGADKKDSADMWKWDKRNSSSDISPLVAVTLAAWGYRKLLHEAPKAATPWIYRR